MLPLRTFTLSSRLLLAATFSLAGTLTACGDGGDHAHYFTGTWTGTTAMSVNGTGEESSTPLNITSEQANTLKLGNFCTDGSGPTATAISADTFQVQPFECSPERTESCDALVFKVTGGTGKLSAGKLNITVEGIASGCGNDAPYEKTFTGESLFDQDR